MGKYCLVEDTIKALLEYEGCYLAPPGTRFHMPGPQQHASARQQNRVPTKRCI